MLDILNRRQMSHPSSFSAQYVPRTGGQLQKAHSNLTQNLFRTDSSERTHRKALNTLMDPHYADDPDLRTKDQAQRQALVYGKPQEELDGARALTPSQIEYVLLAQGLKSRGVENIPTWSQVQEQAEADVAGAKQEAAIASSYNLSTSPRMRAFAGGAQGGFTDPVNLAAVGLSLPMAVSTNVARTVAAEAALGFVSEGVIQAEIKRWHDELGEEYTANDIALAMAAGTLIPAAFGAGVSGLYRKLGGSNTSIFSFPAEGISPAAQREAAQVVEDNLKPYIRRATADLWGAGPRPALTPEDMAAGEFGEVVLRPRVLDPNDVPDMRATWAENLDEVLPFAQAMPHKFMFIEAAAMPPGSTQRSAALTHAHNYHLRDNNPAATGGGIDQFSFNYRRSEMEAQHFANTRQAIDAINTRGTVAPPHKLTLSADLFGLADNAGHIRLVQDLKASDTAIKLGVTAYDNTLAREVARIVGPQLRATAEGVVLPQAPTPRKPRISPEKLQARILENERAMHRAKMNLQRVQRWMYAEKMDEKKFLKREPKILQRIEDLEKRIEEDQQLIRRHERHEASQAQQTSLKAAKEAQRQLDVLANGKVPKALHPLRDKLHESLTKVANDARYSTVQDLTPLAKESLDSSMPTSATWAKPRDMTIEEVNLLIKEKESPAVVGARDADFARLDANMELIDEDGAKVTVQVLRDRTVEEERTLQALKTCGLPEVIPA